LTVVVLDHSIEYRSNFYRLKAKALLSAAAKKAGLVGDVALVWPYQPLGFRFCADPIWHTFLRSINYGDVIDNVNKRLFIDISKS